MYSFQVGLHKVAILLLYAIILLYTNYTDWALEILNRILLFFLQYLLWYESGKSIWFHKEMLKLHSAQISCIELICTQYTIYDKCIARNEIQRCFLFALYTS